MLAPILLLLYFSVNSAAANNCGGYMCGSANYYQAYAQQQPATATRYQASYIPQQMPQHTSQPMIQYYYPANTYQIAPQQPTLQKVSPPVISSSVDKESLVTTGKMNYDDFEKELEKLKPASAVTTDEKVDSKLDLNVLNASIPTQSITYIREFPSGYSPEAFITRPLPYRPVPYMPVQLPAACQQYFLPPQRPQPMPQVTPQIIQLPSAYVTAPPVTIRQQPLSILPPPINDCCGKCGAPCKFRSKKNVIALASKIFTAQFVPRRDGEDEEEPKDPKCSSEKLKDLMNKYITRTVALSKRLIQKNAESELGGYFSVFCSIDDFSYVARSEMFCQLQKNDITCYAFKHK
ncbi:Ground-like domain-containing protein [Caenorhabditis elegans]|uniref:Ground-like domain-containing protein n=1 Tax=Caenorhabditis elegans TaxID=6239 RepID=O76386_CAEEL|nr:Ground-like domain-containing protein [Caenorhabditis elegans]CCD65134.1 Ground-like domain-containing protein [Caenorhabditis elegans]|eukprot:NP_504460.1 GRound-Like (grd related) [Caenorhabditis elegans]